MAAALFCATGKNLVVSELALRGTPRYGAGSGSVAGAAAPFLLRSSSLRREEGLKCIYR